MLVNGKWSANWNPIQKKDEQGRFLRIDSAFRDRIPQQMINDELAENIHLYVALICPWATRALIARSILGLEKWVPVSIVEPSITDEGWQFGEYPGSTPRHNVPVTSIHELYTTSHREFTGRATVPVLWDNRQKRIINNESSDILDIFNRDLRPLHQSPIDLKPVDLASEIEGFNVSIYNTLNNGVYQTGLASSQLAYQEALRNVFQTLDLLENHFFTHDYCVGNSLTESDIRLFVTLVRFDIAYYGIFKTNLKQIKDYTNLSCYLNRLLELKAFSENTNIDHIKTGYYSIKALNPSGIVPVGPELSWLSKVSQ